MSTTVTIIDPNRGSVDYVFEEGLPVQQVGSQGGSLTNRSGTITAGGVSQQMAAANASRRYLLVQNISTHDLWINFGSAATVGGSSILLAGGVATVDGNLPGGVFSMEGSFVCTDAVHVLGGTTNQTFVAKEG